MSAPFSAPISVVTIAAGGTAQTLLAAADATTPRESVLIQPTVEACVINWGGQTAGIQATGTLTAGANATDTETIAVNGVTFTFTTGASTATNVHIGAAKEDTMTNLAAVLNASVNAAITVATYSVSGAVVTATYVKGGTVGNAYTLADSSSGHVTKSAATLTGGVNTAGGLALALNQIGIFNASDFPQIKGLISVVSATTSSTISVSYGQG